MQRPYPREGLRLAHVVHDDDGKCEATLEIAEVREQREVLRGRWAPQTPQQRPHNGAGAIAREHGGTVEFERLGNATVFSLKLPLTGSVLGE